MNVFIRQDQLSNNPSMCTAHEFCMDGGIWEPIVVQTQKEKDYLQAMYLMMGKDIEVLLDGVDKPKRDTPPTYN